MTETEDPKKPKQRFEDLVNGAEKLEKDDDLVQSRLDSLGLSSEQTSHPDTEKTDPPGDTPAPEIGPDSREDSPDPDAAKRIAPPAQRSSVTPGQSNTDSESDREDTEVLDEDEQPPRSPLDETPPPPLGPTPHTPPPALDARGMPLPRRIDDAPPPGRTSPSSPYRSGARTRRTTSQPPEQPSKLTSWWRESGPGGWSGGQGWGCAI